MNQAGVLPFVDTGVNIANTAANLYLAFRQERFQERMANTAVQRQVADMKKAGINPILAVNSGMKGAAVPTGSSMAVHTPSNLTSAYVQAQLVGENLKALKLQNLKTVEETAKIVAERRLTSATVQRMFQDVELQRKNILKTVEETDLIAVQKFMMSNEYEFIMNNNSGKSLEGQRKQLENALMRFDVELGQKLKAAGQLYPLLQIMLKRGR